MRQSTLAPEPSVGATVAHMKRLHDGAASSELLRLRVSVSKFVEETDEAMAFKVRLLRCHIRAHYRGCVDQNCRVIMTQVRLLGHVSNCELVTVSSNELLTISQRQVF